MFKNTAAKFMVFAWDTTTGVAKTGDAANITAYVSKDYGAVTVLADTSATEMDSTNAKGYYLFDAAQGETNGDVLMVSAKSATANIAVIGAPAVIYTRPTTGWLAPATAGRTLVVDAAGLADANAVKLGPTGSGTAQTARDIGASVLLSTGTGTGQLDFTSGVVKANATQWLGGTIPAVNVTGVPLVDAKYLLGTIFSTPATAGIPDVNLKNIANAAVSTSTAQLGVNAVQAGATAWNSGAIKTTSFTAGAIDAAAIAADAIGASELAADAATEIGTAVWASATRVLTANTNLNDLSAAGVRAAVGLASANLDTQIDALPTNAELSTALGTADDATLAAISALTAPDNAGIAAIKAKTDNLPAAPAATGDAMTLTAAYDFAKGTVAMTESYAANGAAPTPAQALMAIHQDAMDFAISGTSYTVKKLDNATTAFVKTLNDATNPTGAART